jgi:hypothetical protein
MTQHLSAFRRSPGMPSRNPTFPRNSLVMNTGLNVSTFAMKTGKDYYFPICDIMYCGTHIPADSSSCSLPIRISKRHKYTGSKFV